MSAVTPYSAIENRFRAAVGLTILVMSLVDILFERLDQLDGNPLEFKNCLTLDSLIPKFTSSGREPIAFATFNLLSWEHSTPFVFLTDTFTGKFLCFSDLGRGHPFRNDVSVFHRVLVPR